MSWQIRVLNSQHTVVYETKDQTNSVGGLIRARASVDPSGNCSRLEADMIAELFTLTGRNHIELTINGTVVFTGPIVQSPNSEWAGAGPADSDSEAIERVICYGGLEMLKNAHSPPLYIEDVDDVNDIIFAVLSNATLSPSLVLDVANFATLGTEFAPFYYPFGRLIDAIDDVASNHQGLVVGVDADMEVFSRVTTGTTNVDYALLERHPLPIEAYGVITKILMLIASQPDGTNPSDVTTYRFDTAIQPTPIEYYPYLPVPFPIEYAHANHNDYEAERVYPVPVGLNPFLPPADFDEGALNETLDNITAGPLPGDHRDGDPDTYSTVTSVGSVAGIQMISSIFSAYTQRTVGFKLLYEATWVTNDPFANFVKVRHRNQEIAGVQTFTTRARWTIPATDEPSAIYGVFPLDARLYSMNQPPTATDGTWATTINLGVGAGALAASDDFKIYEFIPLIIDLAQIQTVILNTLRLPGTAPQRIVAHDQVIAPAKNINLQNYPGGDLLLPASSFDYIIDEMGLRTEVALDTDFDNVLTAQLIKLFKEREDASLYTLKTAARQ